MAAVVAGLCLQAVIVVWAAAQALFDTTSLRAVDWVLVGGCALLGVAGTVVVRLLGPQPSSRGHIAAVRGQGSP